MSKFLKYYFLSMMASPILAYFAFKIFYGYLDIDYFYRFLVPFIGIIWLSQKQGRIVFPSYLIPLILYTLYTLIWSFFNEEFIRRGVIQLLLNNVNIQTAFILLIIANIRFEELFYIKLVKLIKITVFFALVVTIIQIIYDPLFFTPPTGIFTETEIYQARRPSIFSYIDPNAIGVSFLPLSSILIGFLLYTNGKHITLFLFSIGVIAIATNGRYVIVGYFIILLQFLLIKNKFHASIINTGFRFFSIILLLVLVFQFLGYDFNKYFQERLFYEGSVTGSTRYLAWQVFKTVFTENIFFGTGVHLTPKIEMALAGQSSQIHIGYLSHLVSFGIVGSAFLFSFWFLLARQLYLNAKRSNFYGSFLGFTIFIWANFTMVYYSVFTYGLIITFLFDRYFYYHTSLKVYAVKTLKT